MRSIEQMIAAKDWTVIRETIQLKGYAVVKDMLSPQDCEILKKQYVSNDLYRKTVVMERYRFGLGEYRYYNYPLPPLINIVRHQLYRELAPVANNWMEQVNIATKYPSQHQQLLDHCHANGQEKPTVLILKYGRGGHNTLHQDLYGDIYFPIQVVLFLNEPGTDYQGGEFVLTEQVPRAQSRAIVLQPAKGDMLIFTTNFRPVKGSRGYYRANMKHGVSEVTEGERHTLGIIFHDATS